MFFTVFTKKIFQFSRLKSNLESTGAILANFDPKIEMFEKLVIQTEYIEIIFGMKIQMKHFLRFSNKLNKWQTIPTELLFKM